MRTTRLLSSSTRRALGRSPLDQLFDIPREQDRPRQQRNGRVLSVRRPFEVDRPFRRGIRVLRLRKARGLST